YIEYIDFRVLGILLSLMIVMAAFQENGFFDRVGKRLLKKTKNTRQLCTILIGLCFFFSMLITNDVALITFVPFTMLIFITCRQEELLIPVIVLQTIAANLGSMLTPVGNPQNLYLYNLGGFTLLEFIETMLPYSAISLVAIIVWMLMICRRNKKIEMGSELDVARVDRTIVQKNAVYTILFDLCLLVVLKVLPYYAVLILVVVVTFIMDREVLKKVDYSLIFTFTFFFIFTGNIGRLEIAHSWLQSIVSGRETIVGILVSQIISNVPATLLLS
ncbi:MAG: SLC13 family permease, partial [Bacillota bacterium]|nr:SLC13 family permease [Bacillota bacterium]